MVLPKLKPVREPKRTRYVELKPGKELYRRGDYFAAINFFTRQRTQLIDRIRKLQFEGERHQPSLVLALVNHQLSLCYEAVGNEKMADKRSNQAVKYYVGPNPLGFAMLLRDDGMRMLGRGRIDEAKPLIDQALLIIRKLSDNSEHVPPERIELEHWVARSCMAQVMLAGGDTRDRRKALSLLRTADAYLRDGSKRYRELDNLMALIPHVGPIEQRFLALRAFKLNESNVKNGYKRVWLISVMAVGTPLTRAIDPYLR
jgi:hypothetical protein